MGMTPSSRVGIITTSRRAILRAVHQHHPRYLLAISPRESELVRLIATGSTLAKAAEALNLSSSWGRIVLARACRKLGMPNGLEDIRARAAEYLAQLPPTQEKPQWVLREALRRDLARGLGLDNAEVTPRHLANYSATQLRSIGVTETGIAEVQQWLRRHDFFLKHYSVISAAELKALQRAMFLLDAYHFDVAAAKVQLADEEGDAT